jgi:hypothetical protein
MKPFIAIAILAVIIALAGVSTNFQQASARGHASSGGPAGQRSA